MLFDMRLNFRRLRSVYQQSSRQGHSVLLMFESKVKYQSLSARWLRGSDLQSLTFLVYLNEELPPSELMRDVNIIVASSSSESLEQL